MTERLLRARLYLYSIVLLVFVILWSAVTNVWSAGTRAQVSNEGASPMPVPTSVEQEQRQLAILAQREQAVIREARRATRILKDRRRRYAAALLEQQRQIESSNSSHVPVVSAPVYSAPAYVPPAYSPPPVTVVSTPEPTTQSGSS